MKTLNKIISVLVLLSLTACVRAEEVRIDKYVISIQDNNFRKLHVEAELNLLGNRLSMNWPSVGWLEKGWSQFVENLEIYELGGESVQYSYVDKAEWLLDTDQKRVKISYDVNLVHDKTAWEEGGHSAAAYVLNDVIYSIGAAIFIANPVEEMIIGAGSGAEVYFDLPADSKIAVPWQKSNDETGYYKANSTYELIRSGISLGGIEKSVQHIEGMEVIIATAPDFKEVAPKFQDIYTAIVPIAVDYFGNSTDTKYVVIANNAPKTEEYDPYFSGEALHQTMSLISPIVPTAEYMPLFWYILTHEYLHHWMGITIQANPEDQAWFMEGFTDYISWRLLQEAGQIPADMILNGFGFGPNSIGWGENIKKYLAVAGNGSMVEAGKNKQDNYDLIYSGGSLFALVLDIEMNMRTDGKKGLKDLIQEINRNYGAGTGKILDNDAIRDTASMLCGRSLDYLFDSYVEGTEVIPVEDYIQRLGIKIVNLGKEDQQLSVKEDATSEQLKYLQRIAGITD